MKIAIIVCTHAVMAQGIQTAAEMICGPQEDFYTIGLAAGEGLEHIEARLNQILDRLEMEGKTAIVFCDLCNATPYNGVSFVIGSRKIPILSGISLPEILEVVLNREDTDDSFALAQEAFIAGQEGMRLQESGEAPIDDEGEEDF